MIICVIFDLGMNSVMFLFGIERHLFCAYNESTERKLAVMKRHAEAWKSN